MAKCDINTKLSEVSDLGSLLSLSRPVGVQLTTLHSLRMTSHIPLCHEDMLQNGV